MTERGEPKNLIVEDKKTAEKMTERGDQKTLLPMLKIKGLPILKLLKDL